MINGLYARRQSAPVKIYAPSHVNASSSCIPEIEYEPKPSVPMHENIAEGTYRVVARALVGRGGDVMNVDVLQGADRQMRMAVIKAMMAHRYKAHTCGSEEGVWVERTYTFTY